MKKFRCWGGRWKGRKIIQKLLIKGKMVGKILHHDFSLIRTEFKC